MSKARFGVIIPQGWRLDLPSLPAEEQFEMIKRTTLAAEELGFDSAWLYDHLLTYPEIRKTSCFESWTTLTALAMATSRIRLGTIVTCNSYRSPALLAKTSSIFDVVSGGRLEFGIGAGWYKEEYEAFGYEFPSNASRIRMLDEALTIIKEMWSVGESTFTGRYYTTRGAINRPQPIQKPHPPVTVGGGGEQLTLGVVAKHADRWNANADRETYRHKLDVLRAHCDKAGRSYESIEKSYWGLVSVDRSRDEALRKARQMPSGGTFESFLTRYAAGTPEDIASFYAPYLDMGVRYFVLYLNESIGIESLKLFRDEVISRL